MLRLALAEDAQSQLLALPESGMGFQHIVATYLGRRAEFLALNADTALLLSDLHLREGTDQSTIDDNGRKIMMALGGPLSDRLIISSNRPSDIQLASIRVSRSGGPVPEIGTTLVAPSSALVKTIITKTMRTFYRYSAFHPDCRVDPATGDFAAGTYAVPESEAPYVPTGFVAVGRFALPNWLPASFRYRLEAGPGTVVSFGTVAPAFAQAGGGVEACFAHAVNNQAAIPAMTRIPDE